MEKEKGPIKRSAELAPLSRDHHQGLLLAFKLRQGIKKSIEASRMAAYAKWFWTAHLVPHFDKEERYLPPVMGENDPLIQQMMEEHVAIKSKIEHLAETATNEAFEDVAQTITQHIRFEERVLFNEAEKRATPAQLQFLAAHLMDDAVEDVWEDEFWKTKNGTG